MNTNFKVTGLTRLGIKPESTAFEADSLTTRQSELFIKKILRDYRACLLDRWKGRLTGLSHH